MNLCTIGKPLCEEGNMDEQRRMGRREFLGKAAVAAAMAPAVLSAGSGKAGAQGRPPESTGDKARTGIKKIA